MAVDLEDLVKFAQLDWHSARDYLQDHTSAVIIILLTALIGYFSVQSIFTPAIPKVSVPLPPQAQPGWTSKTPSKRSIQTKDPSVIQCYCPATGQLIDTVKAASSVDVDNAIEKAKAAQLKWRQTTFKQRSLVLKTLLKFVLENQGSSFSVLGLS